MWPEGRGRRKTNRAIRRKSHGLGGGVKEEGNYSGSQPECISQQAKGQNGGERIVDSMT